MRYPSELLLRVEKPARYTGGEINAVKKDKTEGLTRFCLCFPDVYEVGMSWTGLNILYYLINRRKDAFCERAFTPWTDMESVLRENNLPLVTLETKTPLADLDILGFTLQHEMSYTNILNMLDLSGIPFKSADRPDGFPIVFAGGPGACNPEPLADFIDFFYIGEAEAALDSVLDTFAEVKREKGGKLDFLRKIAGIKGIYVPSFYDVSYNGDGTVQRVTPNEPAAPRIIGKAFTSDLNGVFYPDKQLVPNLETIHDRVSLEVFRGCIRGCRFCQAGFIYRPNRERTADDMLNAARSLLDSTGHDEVSLLSLSTSDYTQFSCLADGLMALDEHTALSLPSLRIDAFSLELADKISGARKTGLTFAPEAGSQRMRDIINKNITEDEIIDGCRLAFERGWDRVKLYFMIGLPYETEADLTAIADLAGKIVDTYYAMPREKRRRELNVSVSASCFVPKPHTPFQFTAQNKADEFAAKQALIKRAIRKKQVKFTYHSADVSVLEGALARGDRRLGAVILDAFRFGARFDGWTERFDGAAWERAFSDNGLDMGFYAARERNYDEVLPWDHISMGMTKEFFIREMEKAKSCVTTPDCRTSCAGCFEGGCR